MSHDALCSAAIRPFVPVNTFEVRCELTGTHSHHEGVVLDYAYPGSRSEITWFDDDRRNFHGQWPGECPNDCILPAGHPRLCAK